MPSKKQIAIYALCTVLITALTFVLYAIIVVDKADILSAASYAGYEGSNVFEALSVNGGIEMFGIKMPVILIYLIEVCFAWTLEFFVGAPNSRKLAYKRLDPSKVHPYVMETMVVCCTVLIMCPLMTFIASFMYYPWAHMSFSISFWFAKFFNLLCHNLPFAFFGQLFFIQPIIRKIFSKKD